MVHLTGRVEVVVLEAFDLLAEQEENIFGYNSKVDPYCVVDAEGINGSRRIGKSETIEDSLSPKWDFKTNANLNQDVNGLLFTVKDRNLVGSNILGSCFVETEIFANAPDSFASLLKLTNDKEETVGIIRIQIMYTGSDPMAAERSLLERLKIKRDDMKRRVKDVTNVTLFGEANTMLLHGMLYIYIDKAVNLPNLDNSILSFKSADVSDPFVEVRVENAKGEDWRVATTSVIENNLNPYWKESFYINVCHEIVAIKFVIKDKDIISADLIGSISFKTQDLLAAGEIKGDFDIYFKGRVRENSKITLSLLFKSNEELSASAEVPMCYFSMKENNLVTLYQDAHCVGLPELNDGNGAIYEQPRAWKDLYDSIIEARHFIYIVGWSVNTKIALLRWEDEDNRSIGEILAEKAQEGVHVIVMLWDELTSTEFSKAGAMGTYDEETAEYFRNTKVTVVLASRERHTKDISTKTSFTNFCYTHHQKSVILDGPVEGNPEKRKTIAYMGGLDLTLGRFDTPLHPLSGTLDTDHKDDLYNNLWITKGTNLQREPWHDIHCLIEGKGALDLLCNFKERWNKQGKSNMMGNLMDISEFNETHIDSDYKWNVQVFRSINSDSALFCQLPSRGITVKKERLFENSIHRAYVHNIRRSKHYLYIENQYFLGSSHAWSENRESKIDNLIPLEIAAHIEKQIKMNRRFSAYILMPMYPEGRPVDKVIQAILHWQYRTIEMMYQKVALAIKDAEIEAHPQDYLLFFCLGKKEQGNDDPISSDLTGHAAEAFKHKRLMIYVHSKMAIFDDEYVIVGSANINDRSLNGNRDTEIAIGAYQPDHVATNRSLPNGGVAQFRKSLWLEHAGEEAPLTHNPGDLTTIKQMKELAEEGLLTFISEGDDKGARHLLLYPLAVDDDGAVTAREDCPNFPDTTASVIGRKSGYIPARLTS